MNNKDSLISSLKDLGLNDDEATLYLELLRGPASHLNLAHATGINRTKVYRLVEQLEQRSLIEKQVDDTGSYVAVSDVANLSIGLEDQVLQLRRKQEILEDLLPQLEGLQEMDLNRFVVRTFDGIAGFKQMLWHELKSQTDRLVMGAGVFEDLVDSHAWSERYRAMEIAHSAGNFMLRNYHIDPDVTKNEDYAVIAARRVIPREKLDLSQNQICIYDNTVAVYHWQDDKKVGIEILNAAFARVMRQVFAQYWKMALPNQPKGSKKRINE